MLSSYVSTFLHVKSLQRLSTLINNVRGQLNDRVLFYTIGVHPNTAASDIEGIVKLLTSSSRSSVGCLTTPVDSSNGFSLALASFEKDTCTVFNSSEVDRDTVQVGRWHTTARRDAQMDMDLPWNAISGEIGGGTGGGDYWTKARNQRIQVDLPRELEGLRSENICGLLYFTSSRSTALANVLVERFTRAGLLGISASSTPFITGFPHTMFRDGKVQSVGSVGVAIESSNSGEDAEPEQQMIVTGLSHMSEVMKVTDCEGNLIQSLDDRNPARLLMEALQVKGEVLNHKDDEEYYLGVYPMGNRPDSTPRRLYRVLAGGPSRGSIAIEHSSAPEIGTHVQFFKRSRTQPRALEAWRALPRSSEINFTCVVAEDYSTMDEPGKGGISKNEHDDCILEGSFVASSENGFVMTTPRERSELCLEPWHCSVPSIAGSLGFNQRRR